MSEVYEVVENGGNIKISDEVISTIAAVAVSEIDKVTVAGNTFTDIVEKFGKKNISKGIKVISDEQLTIDINVIVEYGVKIHEVAWEVQSNVKKNVELMSGMTVDKVNVHIVGVENVINKNNNIVEVAETEE